jgi:hypothetical protein
MLTPKSKKGLVRFHVSGTSDSYEITYKCKRGKACQEKNASRGWTQTFHACPGEYIYCSAQANSKDSKVHVEILYNGKKFKSSESMGDYAVASAGGILL